jgi:hypothetical protein
VRNQFRRTIKEEKVAGLKKTRLITQDEDALFVKFETGSRTIEKTFSNSILGRAKADEFYKTMNSKEDLERFFKEVEKKVKV